MAYIGKTPVIGNFQVCDAISVVNNQAAYTMQVAGVNVSPESSQHMLVSLNGVIQKNGGTNPSFTVSGSTITFASNLVTGDVIDFIQILGNVLDLGVPSDNTVTTAKLADSSVTTAKLNDASVSLAKLTATGTKDATTFLRGDNTFTAPGGGDIVKIKEVIVTSDVSSIDFIHGTNDVVIDSTYKMYRIIGTVRGSSQGAILRFDIGKSSGFITSNYLAETFRSYYSGGTSRTSATGSLIVHTGGIDNHTSIRGNFQTTFFSMADSTVMTTAESRHQAIDGSSGTPNQVNNIISGGVYIGAVEAHDRIRLKMSTGNVAEAEVCLYGIK